MLSVLANINIRFAIISMNGKLEKDIIRKEEGRLKMKNS